MKMWILGLVILSHCYSYNHIDTPYYKVILTSSYEDNLIGSNLANKMEQDRAMQEFVAGRLIAGEMGNGIELENMKPAEQQLRDTMYKSHGFDEYISEYLVSLNRSLPDRRDDWCKLEGNLPRADQLPSTSIIVIFHNEAWSTLLRTVYSVINRSPPHLVKEIILVDDASTLEHLGQRLEDAVKRMGKKVVLVRQPRRGGLMLARMAGVQVASGEVLTFLDSHVEVTIGWLEPLLQRIVMNPLAVVCPVIEEVNDKTLQYKFVTRNLEGIFYWNLDFGWREINRDDWSPYPIPVMAGGLFAIRKDWFAKLGHYDPGMEIWGGEQLELSFKTWMCGGRVEIVPCSRVGHIFRSFSPYKWDSDKTIPEYNYKRVAAVWMDQWAELYWDRLGNTWSSQDKNVGDFGNVDDRKELRRSLQCQDFGWYLREVMPSLGELHIIGMGEIRNPDYNFCMDQQDGEANVGLPVLVFDCHGEKGNQYWYYRADGRLSHDILCITAYDEWEDTEQSALKLSTCETADRWQYDSKLLQLTHEPSGLCVRVTRHPLKLWLVSCDEGDPHQKWYFTRYQEPEGEDSDGGRIEL